jgi:hypothetical protein
MESPLGVSAPDSVTLELDRPLCTTDLAPHPAKTMKAAVEERYRSVLDACLALFAFKVCSLPLFRIMARPEQMKGFGTFAQGIN